MKRITAYCLILVLMASAAQAAVPSFLSEGLGAAENASGGAMTAAVEGVNAMYWNPAGLASMGACFSQVTAGYNVLTLGRLHAYTGAAFHSDEAGYFGILMNHFSSGKFDIYDGAGNLTGSDDDAQYAAGVSYANFLGVNTAYGVTLRYNYQSLASNIASGYGIDLGVIYQPFMNAEFFLGAMAKNIAGSLSRGTGAEEIPGVYSAGASWETLNGLLKISADMVLEEGGSGYGRAGVQVKILEALLLRAGLNGMQPSAGLGFIYDYMRIDYAYSYDRYDTGDVHEVSLILTW